MTLDTLVICIYLRSVLLVHLSLLDSYLKTIKGGGKFDSQEKA